MKRQLALILAGLLALGTFTPSTAEARTVVIIHGHRHHHRHHKHRVWVPAHFVVRVHHRILVPGHYIYL